MAPRAVLPTTMVSVLASATLFTPVVCHTAMVSTTGAIVPSQRKRAASNCTPGRPAACEAIMVFCTTPICVPSRGACVYRKFAILSPLAPLMFCTITVGWPGM